MTSDEAHPNGMYRVKLININQFTPMVDCTEAIEAIIADDRYLKRNSSHVGQKIAHMDGGNIIDLCSTRWMRTDLHYRIDIRT